MGIEGRTTGRAQAAFSHLAVRQTGKRFTVRQK
jgi:hypothetical protein